MADDNVKIEIDKELEATRLCNADDNPHRAQSEAE